MASGGDERRRVDDIGKGEDRQQRRVQVIGRFRDREVFSEQGGVAVGAARKRHAAIIGGGRAVHLRAISVTRRIVGRRSAFDRSARFLQFNERPGPLWIACKRRRGRQDGGEQDSDDAPDH